MRPARPFAQAVALVKAGVAVAAVAAVGAIGAAGCASSHKPVTTTAADAAPPRALRLIWLPAEAAGAAEVVAAINERLGQVKVAGVTSGARAPVSLEVAQLAIECIEPSAACYAKVGRSLGGDRLAWAEIARGPAPASTVRVALVLFDVGAEAETGRIERTFDDAAAARDGVAALFEHAFEAGKKSASGSGTPRAAAGGKAGGAAVAQERGP